MMFDMSTVDEFIHMLESEIDAPYVRATRSTLGGTHNVSIFVTVSFDAPETWPNRILMNSRFVKLYILNDGEIGLTIDSGRKGHAGMMEHTALRKRFRKTKYKSFEDAIEKINKYLSEAV